MAEGYAVFDVNRKKIGHFFYSLKMHWLDGDSDRKAIAATVEKWISQKLNLIISMSPDNVPLTTGSTKPSQPSLQRTLSILARFPKLDAIYASEDAMGSAIIRALKEKGYTPGQVKVVAQGGSRGSISDLKEGWYLGIVNQDPALCAQQDMWFMAALLEENRRLPRAAQAPQEMITRENASEFEGW